MIINIKPRTKTIGPSTVNFPSLTYRTWSWYYTGLNVKFHTLYRDE